MWIPGAFQQEIADVESMVLKQMAMWGEAYPAQNSVHLEMCRRSGWHEFKQTDSNHIVPMH